MKIDCTVEEFKELLKEGTPVDGTTDVEIKIDGKEIANLCCQNLANRGNFAKEQ